MRGSPGSRALAEDIAGIENGLLRLRSGGLRAVLRTSSLNLHSSSAEQQARTIQAFRELLHTQTGPLELYFRSRRLAPGDTTEPNAREFAQKRQYLAALTRSFIATHLADTPVYHREVYIVLSPMSGSRPLLRSWLFRFQGERSGDSRFVGVDAGVPLRERAQTVIEQLRLMGLSGQLLQQHELEQLAAELSLRPAQASVPRPFTHRANEVELADRHYATFVVDRYPGEEVEPGWLLPLANFKGELHVGIHILPLETDRMLALLHHKIRDLKADEMAMLESGGVAPNAIGSTLPDALSVHQALARNEERAFAVSFYITVGASDTTELQAQIQSLQATCRRMMIRAVRPIFEMRQGLLSSWPLGMDLLGREQILQTSAVSTLMPWLLEDLADADGHYWGYNKETGGLCVFDPFDESRFANANIAVLAHSGAGKSYAAASLVLSGHTRGVGAIILDPEAEYGRMVRALDGTYLHLAAGSGHAINVLDPLVSGGPDIPDQLNDVLDLVALMCGRLDEVERAQLEAALRSVLARSATVPVLRDVSELFEGAHPGSRVATILHRWVSGDLGQLFSAPTNVDLAADVIGFNLRDLKEEVIAPAYLLLANWLWSWLRRERRPRHLLIDEAGLLLEHEPIRRFLVRLSRRIRKYGGSLILVSQNPGDFFETKDGAVLATNASILLLGSQKHSEALKLQKAFSLTDHQVAYLETAQRGDFLLMAGPNRVPVHIMAPPWMDELIVGPPGH